MESLVRSVTLRQRGKQAGGFPWPCSLQRPPQRLENRAAFPDTRSETNLRTIFTLRHPAWAEPKNISTRRFPPPRILCWQQKEAVRVYHPLANYFRKISFFYHPKTPESVCLSNYCSCAEQTDALSWRNLVTHLFCSVKMNEGFTRAKKVAGVGFSRAISMRFCTSVHAFKKKLVSFANPIIISRIGSDITVTWGFRP